MSSDDEDEKVGYRKPPKHSQFRKGQSGNPKGRRKGSRSINFMELLSKALHKKVKVRRGDKVVYLSRLETGIEQFANQVGQGDFQTFRFMMSLGDKIDSVQRHDGRGETAAELSDAKRRLAAMLGLDPKKIKE